MGDDEKREAQEHFERGNKLDESGDREGAVREWLDAVNLDTELESAHFNLGIAFADDGDMERAVHELRQVIRLDPFDVDARRELAKMLFEVDRVDEGISQLRQALNIVQNDPESAHMLAEAYVEREDWDKAEGALDSGGMLEEDADLWYQIGKAYLNDRRREEAILAFRRALVCNPSHRESDEMLRQLHVPAEETSDSDEP